MKRRDLVLAGIEAGRPLQGPRSIHLDVTNACNTNCITCWDHSPLLDEPRSVQWKRQKADPAQLEALLDDVQSLGGLEAVIVSGMGEPFTHPDIERILEAVKSRGLHLTVITNLIPASAERILELGVDQLLIGIHGASEQSYLAFHPNFRREEWVKLHAMLGRFRRAGRRFKHVHVVCDVNAHELVRMVEQGAYYDAEIVNFKLASLKHGTEQAIVAGEKRKWLEEEMVPRARETARELGVATNLDVFAAQLEAGGAATAPIRDIGCFMGFAYARVAVDGTVLFCCNTEVEVGTLARGAKFSELWNGDRWNRTRDRLRRGWYWESCSQCGKVNQNVKLGQRFAKAYGEARLLAVTGRGPTS